MKQSFSNAKSALLQVCRLVHPVLSALISLAVDSSESNVGAKNLFVLGSASFLQ